jgi:hypothetical protein
MGHIAFAIRYRQMQRCREAEKQRSRDPEMQRSAPELRGCPGLAPAQATALGCWDAGMLDGPTDADQNSRSEPTDSIVLPFREIFFMPNVGKLFPTCSWDGPFSSRFLNSLSSPFHHASSQVNLCSALSSSRSSHSHCHPRPVPLSSPQA